MYHLRLIKALSYKGAVSATREHPDTYTDDEAIAQAAVASGYFELVDDGAAPEEPAETPEEPAEGAYGTDVGTDTGSTPEEPESTEEPAEGASEPAYTPAYSGKTLDEMTVAEIETFATYRGVSLKGCKTRAEKVKKLVDELGEDITSGELEYGSPTVVELQTE